jgi:hypothetical protein
MTTIGSYVRGMVIVAVLALSAGCGEDPSVETGSDPIINGAVTTLAPWNVLISMPTGRCTASVLSEHWLLTAAHCVEDEPALSTISVSWANVPGGAELVYQGPSRPYGHRDHTGFDVDNDIALIKLEGAAGVDVGRTGRAKLWGYQSRPWASHVEADRHWIAMGWGLGRTGGSKCPDAPSGKKLFRPGNTLERAGWDALSVSTPSGGRSQCHGDSGSPYLFLRDNELIAFAVSSRYVIDLLLFGDNEQGTLIVPKYQWMYETSHRDGLDLLCGAAGVAGGESFLECREQPARRPPPPPPGTGCSGDGHCCDPDPAGGMCRMCVGRHQQCP